MNAFVNYEYELLLKFSKHARFVYFENDNLNKNIRNIFSYVYFIIL